MEKGTYNGKVTVNGMSEGGYMMLGKRKVILTFSREGSNNGEIQWKIPRIHQKSAYN